MSQPEASAPDPAAELRELLAACLERMESEGRVALEELCRQHPEHAGRLRHRVELLHQIGVLEPPSHHER